jgi:hypothetical protein
VSFKDYLKEELDDSEYNYYEKELKQLFPIDEFGVSFQMKAGNKSTKWITLNSKSILALENFLNNIRMDNKEIR